MSERVPDYTDGKNGHSDAIRSRFSRVIIFCIILLRPKQRKKDHVANGAGIGEQHGEAVDADALASGGWQTVGQSTDVVLVHGVRFFVTARFFRKLLLESTALLLGVVQFAEGVSDLEAADKNLKALDPCWLIRLVLRERRDLDREVIEDRWLDQMFLGHSFEQCGNGFAGRIRRIKRHVRSGCGIAALYQRAD